MRQVDKILKEINSSLGNIDIFMIILKTFVILVIAFLFFAIIDINIYFSFIPSIVYFVSSVLIQVRVDQVRRVEKNFDNLDEMLITARDYKDQDNPVLEVLEDDIVANLKKVEVSRFFPGQLTLLLIIVLVIAVGSLLYVVSNNFQLVDFDDIMEEARKLLEAEEELEEADFTGTEESIMQVGNERLEVEINPVGLDIDFSDVSEEAEYEFTTTFPKEIFISSGIVYEEEFTKDQQILIKRYFESR